jgi:hypothetical protein
MKTVKFYLGVLTPNGWQNNSYRDFDELLTFWLDVALNQGYIGLFHIGSEKPRYDLIDLDFEYQGRLFITASAKWGIRDLCSTTKSPVFFIEEMPIFMALDGWGYECEDIRNEHSSVTAPYNSIHANSNTEGAEKEYDYSNVSIETLYLPVRAINCLRAANINSLEELYGYTVDDLKKLPNLGNKTIVDINNALAKLNYPTLGSFNKIKIGSLTISNSTFDLANGEQVVESGSLYSSSKNFAHLLELIFANLDERQASVLQKRMGYKMDNSMTLEEIGNQEGVTRERIRQIEAKALRLIRQDVFWNTTLVNKLAKIIDNRTSAMPLSGLHIYDPWFSDLDGYIQPFKFFLQSILHNSQFNIFAVRDIAYISRLSESEWQSLLKQSQNFLEASVGKVTRNEARKEIEYFFFGKSMDMLEELFNVACEKAHFSDETDTGVLIGYGKNAESQCKAVLLSSDYPLHYSEVKRKIEKVFGKEHDEMRVLNALSSFAHRFGPGTYGLEKHILLNEQERALICQEVIEIMSNGLAGRQWSLKELLKALYLGDFGSSAYEDKLDTYSLDYVLKQNNNLHYMGRDMYQLKQDGATYTKRIDLKEAVISILKEAGKPLRYEEIKQKIQTQRGLGDTFQIHPKDSLIAVSTGVWGLIERDLPITSEQQIELCEALHALLEQIQKGIHITEIKQLINLAYPPASVISEPSCIFSIAQKIKNEVFTSSHEDYLYLREWGSQRRATRTEAVIKVIANLPLNGKTMHEIIDDVCSIIERKTNSLDFSRLLNLNGARYDEETKRWYRVDESE